MCNCDAIIQGITVMGYSVVLQEDDIVYIIHVMSKRDAITWGHSGDNIM